MSKFTLRIPARIAILAFAFFCCGLTAFAQVTTSAITGNVSDKNGEGLVGVTVVATHLPSGTRYGTSTNSTGDYRLPAVRVGGPYSVSISYTGFESQTIDGIVANLGTASNVDFQMQEAGVSLTELVVAANRSDLFSKDRTGAATTFDKGMITTAPAIGSRSINSITKYNPNGNGSSFGAQDSRLNNFTIDGSVFNNGFGLGNSAQAGGRTGSTAISLDAIEELQVNVAPFDVRQTGFVGSGINAITRSGTNDLSGSVYFNWRDNSSTFNGDEAAGAPVSIGKFNEKVIGLRLGGPIIKNKLFFFVSGEMQDRTEPATNWIAKGSTNVGQETRVEKADLEDLSRFLKTKYGYETGPYEAFDNEISSEKFLARIDYNINDANKLTLRYTHHNSLSDQPISNSNSAGFGNRTLRFEAMAYQNSGYLIGDNTRSIVGELNTQISDRWHNNFIIGYDFQNEDRKYKAAVFPTIDILKDNATYISAGMDPFTPSNQLDYGTFHATNNLSLYQGKHTFTIGANYEYYKSNNLFFPASNGVYVFNSLADFYAAANATADTSPVAIRQFQYRYSALEGGAEPLQVLQVHKADIYGQDEFQVSKRLKISYGIRAGYIGFKQTGLSNPTVDGQSYIDINEKRGYQISTAKLPDGKVLWEPRMGFNWDVTGKKKLQVRGGTGIFTGRPPYVWVSNQIGNNGVLTGFISGANTTKYKFTDQIAGFTPEKPTLPSTFDIAVTDNDYRFPQVWKNNIAVDYKLPWNLVISGELMYNRNINAVLYFDANMEPSTGARFTGPDNRPRFPASGVASAQVNAATRINDNISRAAVMTTTSKGYYQAATFKLEYPRKKGLNAMVAYTVSEAQDLMSAGSIASGSYTGARSINGNNNLDLAFADQDIPNRVIGLIGYRKEYGGKFGGGTGIVIGYEGWEGNRFSYAYGGDMNGDGISGNDLMFVPNNGADVAFRELKVTYKDAANMNVDKIFSPAEQQAAYEAFIAQDEYLNSRRGQYAERNGVLFPFLHRFEVSVIQDFFVHVGGKRNTLQFRVDIINAGNLINPDWGVGNRTYTTTPLSFAGVTTGGTPEYRMFNRLVDGVPQLLTTNFSKSAGVNDVWAAQFSLRYIFN